MAGRFGKPDATGRSSGKLGGRRGRMQKPPEGEPWVWLTREILASDAWKSLGVNARRFLDFLLIEHMNHAGTENGNLRATYGQLEAFGVGAKYVSAAIAEAEAVGLIDAHRGGMRTATIFTLTWLPDRDGAPATDRWKRTRNQKSAPQLTGRLPPKGEADSANLPPKGEADATPQKGGPSISCRGDPEHAPVNGTSALPARLPWSTPSCLEEPSPEPGRPRRVGTKRPQSGTPKKMAPAKSQFAPVGPALRQDTKDFARWLRGEMVSLSIDVTSLAAVSGITPATLESIIAASSTSNSGTRAAIVCALDSWRKS